MAMNISGQFFRALHFVEKAAAFAQGKGYGAGTIKREVSAALSQLTKAPNLVIDVGGNIGAYSQELRSRCPDVEIHIFEPSQVNQEQLKQRFLNTAKVTINPEALSNSNGEAILFSDRPGSGLGSLTQRNLQHLGITFNVRENVSTIRFEDYWRRELSSREIDIAKLDIEGNELIALEGFGAALSSIRVIQVEFGGCNIDTRTYFRDFYSFFSDNEFRLLRISPFGLVEIQKYREADEMFSTTNFIAKNCKTIQG